MDIDLNADLGEGFGPWRMGEDEALLEVLSDLPSPVVFVTNEVGWGIVPMSREVRAFVDELGWLNQAVAQRCGQVTLMVAGQAWTRPVTPHEE